MTHFKLFVNHFACAKNDFFNGGGGFSFAFFICLTLFQDCDSLRYLKRIAGKETILVTSENKLKVIIKIKANQDDEAH